MSVGMKRSLNYFVDAQLQYVGHRLQALDRHAGVACGFVALNLLLRESHSLGQRLLREVADDPRLDQRFTDTRDRVHLERYDRSSTQGRVLSQLLFEFRELTLRAIAHGLERF